MTQDKRALSDEAIIEDILKPSLTSAQSFFHISAFSSDRFDYFRQALRETWTHIGEHQGQQNVVNDLAVAWFSLPWSERPVLSFYNRCIEQWTIDELNTCVLRAEKRDRYICESVLIESVIQRLANPSANRPNGMLMSAWRENILDLLQSYLTDSCSQAELRKLSLARNLTTEDRYILLQCIWRYMQGANADQLVKEHTRICLCVDAVETILDYSAKEQRELTKGLMYLISSTGSFLTTWLNISTNDPDVIVRVKKAFGTGLWEYLDEDLTE